MPLSRTSERKSLLFDWITEIKAELAKPQTPDLVSLLNDYYTQRKAGAYSQKGKSIDITAAVRSLLFIGKLKDSPTTRVLIHEKSSLAPPGQSLAFSLGDEKGFEWVGAYDITADELLAGTDTQDRERRHRLKC